jgi:hypothetical protein
MENYKKKSYFNKNRWTKEKVKLFIEMIGEPLIKNSLRDMYFTTFPEKIQQEIDKLTLLKQKMKL